MKLNSTALRILEAKYLKSNETPELMCQRVAHAVAKAEIGIAKELYEKEFEDILTNLDFLPNSPCLMNAGQEMAMLFACYVLPIEDSLDSIMTSLHSTATIFKAGGGVGFNFSKLRPKDSRIKTSGGKSSGPVSFMRMYDVMTDIIKQGGVRKGAMMSVLNINHPDIEEFIQCKQDITAYNNINISVGITNEFMLAVLNEEDWTLEHPKVTEKITIPDKKLFDLIVDCAWKTGEPGVLFIDTINQTNPFFETHGMIDATNPCGEQTLYAWESCVLGSINLANMVNNHQINVDKIKKTVELAVRFLDNCITVNDYPLQEIKNITQANRKIGLGIMGFADMLVKLEIPYNSPDAFLIAAKVMNLIDMFAQKYSEQLGDEKGYFPSLKDADIKCPRRNSVLTTIAPTGTISMIAGCSSGIEPYFMLTYYRNMLGTTVIECNELFKQALVKAKKSEAEIDNIIKKVFANNGSCQGIEEVPEYMQKVFLTAQDINYEAHVHIQSIFQEFVGASISKTINLPQSATREDVYNAFMLAWDKNCKGMTVYRDGCRGAVYTTNVENTNLCPECKSELDKTEKCRTCKNCGWSKCNV